MAPPKFGDLNKQVTDMFSKGFCECLRVWTLTALPTARFRSSFQPFQTGREDTYVEQSEFQCRRRTQHRNDAHHR